jgi:hypothetical protein
MILNLMQQQMLSLLLWSQQQLPSTPPLLLGVGVTTPQLIL